MCSVYPMYRDYNGNDISQNVNLISDQMKADQACYPPNVMTDIKKMNNNLPPGSSINPGLLQPPKIMGLPGAVLATSFPQSNCSITDTTSQNSILIPKPVIHVCKEEQRCQVNTDKPLDLLVCLHLVTCGLQGDKLGLDETPVVQLSFSIVELSTTKVIDVKKYDVSPSSPFFEHVGESGLVPLSEEVQKETGITNEYAETLKFNLSQVLNEVDGYLRMRGLHPEFNGTQLCLVTEGPLPLRNVLHPASIANEFRLHPYYFAYFDICKEAVTPKQDPKKLTGPPPAPKEPLSDLKAVMEHLSVDPISVGDRATWQCQNMASVVKALTNSGHLWIGPEKIDYGYKPAVFKREDAIEEGVAVKVRGLPWSATIMDLRVFFRGVTIAPGGVALVLSKNGRRNGEAMVRFVDPVQRQLAEDRHKHHLGKRCIEVISINSEEFVHTAGCDIEEGEEFLNQITCSDQTVVRMRGLPYDASYENIAEFFANVSCDVQFSEKGVLFVHHPDGRATGDAFVLFETEDIADRAITRHKDHIGDRYVELFKSTPAEVNQVMHGVKYNEIERKPSTNHTSSITSTASTTPHQHLLSAAMAARAAASLRYTPSLLPPSPFSHLQLGGVTPTHGAAPGGGLLGGLHPLAAAAALNRASSGMFQVPPPAPSVPATPPNMLASGANGGLMMKASILIKGGRPETVEADIRTFLGQHQMAILPNGIQFVYNVMSQWTGLAIITFNSEVTAFVVAQQKNGHPLTAAATGKENTVEVSYIGDMNALLSTTRASQLMPTTRASMPYPGITGTPYLFPTTIPQSQLAAQTPPSAQYNPYLGLLQATNSMQPQPPSNSAMGRPSLPAQSSPNNILQAYQNALRNGGLLGGINASQSGLLTAIPPPPLSQNSSMGIGSSPNSYTTPTTSTALYYQQQPQQNFGLPSAGVASGLGNVVIGKGLPQNATYDEIAAVFLTVFPTITILDIKISLLPDEKTPSGDAYIFFGSRRDAELAATHCNRSFLRDHVVNLYLAQSST